MSALTFTSADLALAGQTIIDEAIDAIPFTTQSQINVEVSRVSYEWRSAILNFGKLHEIIELGDPSDGNPEVADQLAQEIKCFRESPDTYLAHFHSADMPEQVIQADEEQPQQAMVCAPAPQAALVMPANPAVNFENAVNPSPIEKPIAKIRLVNKPAGALFPGISSDYQTDLVPTAAWETPTPVLRAPDPHYRFDGFKVAIMALAIEERKNVIATGDPGCGKTEFFRQFGIRIGLPTHKIPMDGSLTRAEIIGSFRQIATPTGSATPFVYGLIPQLIQQPGIIILDEIDQADPDIMYMLHSVFEGDGLTIQEDEGTFIPRHPHCYIVATANTKGRGSDNGLTHSRFEMSEATRDRFPYWLNFTYLEKEEETETIHAKTGLALDLCAKMVTIANEIRAGYRDGLFSQTCSLRQMLDVAPVANRFAVRSPEIGLAIGMGVVIVGRANTEDATLIKQKIKDRLAVNLTAEGF